MPLANFTNLDFSQVKTTLREYLKENSNFTDYDFEGSNLSTILDVLAYNTYITSYNANMVANEVFIDSATLRENIVSLARNIGYSKALEFAIEAKKISSQECLQLGIANKVCSPENLESETQKWAQAISMRSPQAVSNTKKIMRDSLEKKFIQTYEDEANTQNSILGNDEFKEGVAAFFEKRKPVFK